MGREGRRQPDGARLRRAAGAAGRGSACGPEPVWPYTKRQALMPFRACAQGKQRREEAGTRHTTHKQAKHGGGRCQPRAPRALCACAHRASSPTRHTRVTGARSCRPPQCLQRCTSTGRRLTGRSNRTKGGRASTDGPPRLRGAPPGCTRAPAWSAAWVYSIAACTVHTC